MENTNTMERLSNEILGYMTDYAGQLEALGLTVLSANVQKKIKEYTEGIFSVMFTGAFNNGKTTTLNALTRRGKGRTSSAPETPVIVKYVNGEDDGTVEVHFNDVTRPPERIPFEEFSEKYRLDGKDEHKFKDIDCLVVRLPLFNSGIQFVDSPGLQNTDTEDKISMDYCKNADAVVVLINATQSLNAEEKKFINKNFTKEKYKNVFFVVNFWNAVQDEESVINRLHNELYAVFADENGEFDEELFNKRVFYVDAYQSECARCQKPYIVKKGAKKVEETPNDEYTGMAEFEEGLKEFLNSGTKVKDSYGKYLRGEMSAQFKAAEKHIDEQLELMKAGIDELIEKKNLAENEIKELERIVKRMQNATKTAMTSVLQGTKSAYQAYVNAVESDWDSYFEKTEVDFGGSQMIGIAWQNIKNSIGDVFGKIKGFFTDEKYEVSEVVKLARDERMKKITKPIETAIDIYLKSKSVVMKDKIKTAIEDASDFLDKELEDLNSDIKKLTLVKPEEIMDILFSSIGVTGVGYDGDINLGQFIIAVLFWNVEGGLDALTGNKSWGSFMMSNLITEIAEVIVGYTIVVFFELSQIWFLIAFVVAKTIMIERSARSLGQKIVTNLKEELVKTMRSDEVERKTLYSLESKLKIGMKGIVDATNKILEVAEQKKANLERLILIIKEKQTTLEEERKRMNGLLANMYNCYNEINKRLYGKEIKREDI